MPRERRGLLIVLALVVIGGLGWRLFGSGGEAPVPGSGTGARRQAATPADTQPLPVAESVRLSSLPQSRGEPGSADRNPFKFERRAAPAAAGGAVAAAPVFTPAPVEPPVPAGPAPPPPIPLKFIGVVEKDDGEKWAVLSAGDGRAPLHGKEGDIIDGRYRILKIGTESIDIAYVDGRGRQTIRLTGQ
jgi:hypothetical protein